MKRRFSTAVFLLIKNSFGDMVSQRKLTKSYCECIFEERYYSQKQLKILPSCNSGLSNQQLNKDFYYEQSGRNCKISARTN